MSLVYKEESCAIMGACFEVYREMGAGFLESVYHECLMKEFKLRQIPAAHEPQLEIAYKGQVLEKRCEPDFVCHSKIVVELKACRNLDDGHRAQVLNYLRATGFQLGLLVNFGHQPQLEWERLALSKERRPFKKDAPNLLS